LYAGTEQAVSLCVDFTVFYACVTPSSHVAAEAYLSCGFSDCKPTSATYDCVLTAPPYFITVSAECCIGEVSVLNIVSLIRSSWVRYPPPTARSVT